MSCIYALRLFYESGKNINLLIVLRQINNFLTNDEFYKLVFEIIVY